MQWIRLLPTACVFSSLAAEKDTDIELFRRLRREPGNPVHLDELKKRLPSMTDPAVHETALAACALGLLHNENTAEAVLALKALTTQYPKSEHLGLIRFEELDRHCRKCDGAKTTLTANCPKCQGGRRCLVCHGRGVQVVLNNKRVTCLACEGSGRCLACKGVGRLAEPCQDCRGRGSVLDHRKVKQTSSGILQGYLSSKGIAPEPAEESFEEKEPQDKPRRRNKP